MASVYKDSNGRLHIFPSEVAEGINVDANGDIYNIKDTGAGVWDTLRGLRFPDVSLTPAASFLLDTYTADAAYSTRQLSSTATNCVRVRETGGDTETDIGFSNGWLDEAAIATFCGANNGFITKWYDQSGNSKDAIQATTTDQPQIYDGAAVTQENGKPALSFTSTDKALTIATFSVGHPMNLFSVANTTSAGDLHLFTSNSINYRFQISTARSIMQAVTSVPITDAKTGQNLYNALFNTTSSGYRRNGTAIGGTFDTGSATASNLSIGRIFSSVTGTVQEVVIFKSDQTANFSGIETNINDSFSVYA